METKQLTEAEVLRLSTQGYLFTFDNADRHPRWGKIKHALHSYMGYKLFLSNGHTKMATMLKAMRCPNAVVTPISVRRA